MKFMKFMGEKNAPMDDEWAFTRERTLGICADVVFFFFFFDRVFGELLTAIAMRMTIAAYKLNVPVVHVFCISSKLLGLVARSWKGWTR